MQSWGFFGQFWIFPLRFVWNLLESWYLRISDMEISKFKLPCLNETVAVPCKGGELADFQDESECRFFQKYNSGKSVCFIF